MTTCQTLLAHTVQIEDQYGHRQHAEQERVADTREPLAVGAQQQDGGWQDVAQLQISVEHPALHAQVCAQIEKCHFYAVYKFFVCVMCFAKVYTEKSYSRIFSLLASRIFKMKINYKILST